MFHAPRPHYHHRRAHPASRTRAAWFRDGVAPRDADRVDAPGEQGAVVVASEAVDAAREEYPSSLQRASTRVVGTDAAMNGSVHVVAAQHDCCYRAVVRLTQFQVLHASLALLLRHYCCKVACINGF